MINKIINIHLIFIDIGDWGLGIGDWAQSPIPNPQSPIKMFIYLKSNNNLKIYNLIK